MSEKNKSAGAAAAEETAPAEKKVSKPLLQRKVFCAKTGGGLALRIVLALVIPYAYLMLCGLVFDKWLHAYGMTTFIFFSYAFLALLGVAMIVLCIVSFVKRGKNGAKP